MAMYANCKSEGCASNITGNTALEVCKKAVLHAMHTDHTVEVSGTKQYGEKTVVIRGRLEE